MRRIFSTLFVLTALQTPAQAPPAANVLGDWQEPGGSILRVFSCGSEVCMRIMTLRPNTPHLNNHDPDPARRSEPLCGLQIGYGFKPEVPGLDRATDGRVYDPQSGKTYRGEMHSEGDLLHLRGYILFPALGRTERWKRVAPVAVCHEH